jgi:nucleoside-diphosphate-sugar epimerase
VADERPYPMREVLVTVKDALRDEGFEVSARQLRLPAKASDVAEAIDRRLQRRGMYHQEMHVMGEMGKTIACDISATTEQLGYRPAYDLQAGMRRAIRWCREQGIEL